MHAQYLLHNNKTLFYIEHALYRLYKIKIVFENYHLINLKPFQSVFNYLKFYAIIYFIYYIWDYSNIIYYDIIYSEMIYKYIFKVFYNLINKKKYELQVLWYNNCYINVFAM